MRIALLDNDPLQHQVVQATLERAGHRVFSLDPNPVDAPDWQRESFDLLILHWQSPDLDGVELLRKLRGQDGIQAPILLIAPCASEAEVVSALDAGADDCLAKPVRTGELAARVRALLRRAYPPQTPQQQAVQIQGYRFDLARHRVSFAGKERVLTQKEFDLALFLFTHKGRSLSRSHLLEAVWGRHEPVASRTLDTHVSRVRSKLDLRPENGFRLVPVYGVGYRLETLEEEGCAPGL